MDCSGAPNWLETCGLCAAYGVYATEGFFGNEFDWICRTCAELNADLTTT